MSRAFGVAAGLDPDGRGAARRALPGARLRVDVVERPPRRQGARDAGRVRRGRRPDSTSGVAVIALDRHGPGEIAADIERLGLDRERLWLGVGAGFSKKPLTDDARGPARAARGAAGRPPGARRDGPEDVRPRRSRLRRRLLQLDDAGVRRRGPRARRGGRRRGRPRAAAGVRLRPHRGRRGRRASAWPRRRPSTATSTTATATTSTASASRRARSASPPQNAGEAQTELAALQRARRRRRARRSPAPRSRTMGAVAEAAAPVAIAARRRDRRVLALAAVAARAAPPRIGRRPTAAAGPRRPLDHRRRAAGS